MNINTATIERKYGDKRQTPGQFIATNENGEILELCSLELPDLDNHPQTSCIPAGTYAVRYTLSRRFTEIHKHNVFTYEIMDVPGRSGIRIHSGNYSNQSLGCVLLGKSFKDINDDDVLDVIQSKESIAALEVHFQYQDFQLTII